MSEADPIALGIAVRPDSDRECDIFWCQKYITNSLPSATALWKRFCYIFFFKTQSDLHFKSFLLLYVKSHDSFRTDGSVSDHEDPGAAKPGETVGACLAARLTVPPRGRRKVYFALAWDNPVIRFSCGRGKNRENFHFISFDISCYISYK
jgi:hypothetical protein